MLKDNRLRDIANKSIQGKKSVFNQILEKARSYHDWKDIIVCILNQEKGSTQFQLLRHYLTFMESINYQFLESVMEDLDNQIDKTNSLASALIMIKYVLKTGSKSNAYYSEKAYKYAQSMYGLLEAQVKSLKEKITEKNKIVLTEIQIGIDMVPYIFTRCKMLLNTKDIPKLLTWMCVVPSESIQSIISLGKFSEFLVNSNPQKDDQSKITRIRDLLLSVLECCASRYPYRSNLIFLLQTIPVNYLSKAIRRSQKKFSSIEISIYLDCWKCMFENGSSSGLLVFILEISNLYKMRNEQNHLESVFEIIIQKIVFKSLKFNRVSQPEVQQLVMFYFNNWMVNNSGRGQSLEYLFDDFQRLDVDYKCFWATFISETINLGDKIKLSEKLKGQIKQHQIETNNNSLDFKRLRAAPIIPDKPSPNQPESAKKNTKLPTHFDYTIIQPPETKPRNYSDIRIVETVFNILYNSQKLPQLFEKSPQINQIGNRFMIKVSDIFTKMAQKQVQGAQKLITQLYKQELSTDCTTVEDWISLILKSIRREIKYYEHLLKEFDGLFGIEMALEKKCRCRSSSDLLVLYSIRVQYGDNLTTQESMMLTCDTCRKKDLTVANLLLLPQLLIVTYPLHSQKNPRPFKINSTFQSQHILTMIQFRTPIKGQIHIAWRDTSNLTTWMYYNGEEIKEIETESDRHAIQEHLTSQLLPEVVIYQRLQK